MTLSPHDRRYIGRHHREFDPEFIVVEDMGPAFSAEIEVRLVNRAVRPKRERSLVDVSLLVDTLIVETDLTDQRLADGMGVHRCTVEKMRNGTLGGRPSVEKLLNFIRENGYMNIRAVYGVMRIVEGG